MGKRSSMPRRARNFYPTPREAVLPLLPHLRPGCIFAEPCAGDGALIRHLMDAGHDCHWASDIHPLADWIAEGDVLHPAFRLPDVDLIITNPPWDRTVLHGMIPVFVRFAPTWLLLDADWVHTKQSAPFLPMLQKIVSVGRVRWIPGSASVGKDNCAWHLFDRRASGVTLFVGRVADAA